MKSGNGMRGLFRLAALLMALAVLVTGFSLPGNTARAASVRVGDVVTFGSYEQDGNNANGKEPLRWIVLDSYGDMALLLAQSGISCERYNNEKVNVTWEDSSLREWLNWEFYYDAFDSDQRGAISGTYVDNYSGNPDTGKSGGNDTWDNLFLLSITEARTYLSSASSRICYPTQYAKNRGADISQSGACWWWLRSPGSGKKAAVYCDATGYLEAKGSGVDSKDLAVRPAMWVDTSDDGFGYSGASVGDPYTVGSYVLFGSYPQNGNGYEDICWRIVDRTGDWALLLSEYGLDCLPYNNVKVNTSWAECSLRAWLNDSFYYEAFSDWERSTILGMRLDNQTGNLYTGKSGGQNTYDHVFLLSLDEVGDVLSSQNSRVCYPTNYAVDRGADYNQSGGCWWWLRSPGSGMKAAAYCDASGYLTTNGSGVDNDDIAVRPAIWVDVSSWR